MTKIIYPELSYTVQGALYDVYNELRYFDLSEEGWENGSLPISTRQAWRLRRCGYDDMTTNQAD